MIKKFVPILLGSLLLASCQNQGPSENTLRIVTPLGAPSAIMYDQGSNADWDAKAPVNLPAELQGNFYDVVVFDALTGLESIRKNNLDFVLAKVVTGGNFFLMGVNTDDIPTSESKIVSFQKDKAPDKVFLNLANEKWGLGSNLNIEYVTGDVSSTAAVLKTGKFNGQPVDYVLSAEPVITSVKNSLDEGVSLTEIYNMRTEWKEKYNQDAIVQAGVFVRKSSISSKNALLSDFMRKLESRCDILVSNPEIAANCLNEYSADLDTQKNRFGINANVLKALQSGNKNRLGIIQTSETVDVNVFLETLGQVGYPSTYFVNI